MTEPSPHSGLHSPVLLDRVLDLLSPALAKPGSVVVDATLGLGGHTESLLTAFPDVQVIGIDRDPVALGRARARLEPFGDRVTYAQAVYDEIGAVVTAAGHDHVAGVLFDLGVSSMQLDLADRGFSYSQDAPLDMRMNPEDELTAAILLNTYSAQEIARVLRHYGEEKFAKRIADAVVAQRANEPFTTSARLVDLIRDSIPQAARRTGGNPAKRTFQALRIEVNDELGALTRALPASLDTLEVGGRVVVLAYHSLEDRLTKQAFARVTKSNAPRDLPVVPVEMMPKFKLVTRGSEQASEAEIAANRRAQSVRLRAVERIAV
ncbi:MAG: 16S rRNA (cytosine(1402)-N(4))-methyltransferase RsmH [Actinomycetota bacterium]|nr:16S rRNA (cytosine(1402)-N(4))-methyltransferase RsmH [Actinomycetota bacterium]